MMMPDDPSNIESFTLEGIHTPRVLRFAFFSSVPTLYEGFGAKAGSSHEPLRNPQIPGGGGQSCRNETSPNTNGIFPPRGSEKVLN